jgi:hypothetical protein
VEFKKGMRGVEEEINRVSYASDKGSVRPSRAADHGDEPTAPKFEPPPEEQHSEVNSD